MVSNAERCKAYAELHREELTIKRHEYYLKNRDSFLSKRKEYYQNNREQISEYQKEYRKKNKPDKKRIRDPEKRKVYSKRARTKLWLDAIAFFGPCACCGESTREFLSVDHINGNGGEHRRKEGRAARGFEILKTLRMAGWPEESKKEYRLLCHNCNQAIGHFGYCPHQKENYD